jgi:hypothetical protein
MNALARCLIGLLMMIGAALWGTGTGQAASNIQQINTIELQAMMNESSGFHLINVLPKIIHDARHIPGSVNIPLGQIKGGAVLPEGLDTPLVFYCMGLL